MSKHTPGPWQVITDEHPHFAGGKHIERRIFTAWDHPQMKGPTGVVNLSIGIGAEKGDKARPLVSISEADARLIAAAPDLLAALQAFADEIVPNNPNDPLWVNARAAIAKATGGNDAK